MAGTIATLQMLHSEGRDHIWAYYTRNLVRPVALARRKVDVIIGNPPWINYNQTASILRAELERQSKERYGIWQGGRYATHQDVAGLFFTRSMDLYSEGRRPNRHGDAPQRVADGAVRQVAHRQMAGSGGRHHAGGGLQRENGLGPGTAGAEHLLPGPGVGSLRPDD